MEAGKRLVEKKEVSVLACMLTGTGISLQPHAYAHAGTDIHSRSLGIWSRLVLILTLTRPSSVT